MDATGREKLGGTVRYLGTQKDPAVLWCRASLQRVVGLPCAPRSKRMEKHALNVLNALLVFCGSV